MRRPTLAIAVALLASAATGARAEIVQAPADPPAQAHDFWRDLVEPHAAEVDRITTAVQQHVLAFDAIAVEPGTEPYQQLLETALGKLVYARKLAPENLLVLDQLAHVADDLGRTRQAIEALQAALDIAGPDKAGPEITGRLGAIELRLGDRAAAIRYLRLAAASAGTNATGSGEILIDLSTALALDGQTNEALDVLQTALPPAADYNAEQWGIAFALAVQYDRDDERDAAFAILDRLQALLQDQSYANQMQSWFGAIRFTPAEDQHYYAGLLYETAGDYSEARAEWALYAASGGAYRGRALEHVAAIDAERRRRPGHVVTTAAGAPAIPMHHRHHVILPMPPRHP